MEIHITEVKREVLMKYIPVAILFITFKKCLNSLGRNYKQK